MEVFKKYFFIAAIMTFLADCKHPFDPPLIPANTRPLVVEGFLNGNPGESTQITLSRVQDPGHADSLLAESGASMQLEGEDGYSYPFYAAGPGMYTAFSPNLVISRKYRLHITTVDGNQYISDYVPLKSTPPIDSLEWDQNSDVMIYVNTHDPLNQTTYYRWDYAETWNYLSNLSSPWGVENRKIFVKDSLTQTDSCWRNAHSTQIVTGSSQNLGEDLISHYAVAEVPQNSEKISYRYSILVSQYALTKETYDFYQIMKKNTQQTGSLFDPQPSQLPGNIHCVTNPGEEVIGFISASTVTRQRLFIRYTEISNWHYEGTAGDCGNLIATFQNPYDFSIFDYPDTTYAPYYFTSGGGMVVVKKSCTYCTYYGGTNVKPDFW